MPATSPLDLTAPRPAEAQPIFRSIVCGIDASRADREVARQAALLAAPDGTVTFVSVVNALLSRTRAQEALGRAAEIAVEAGRKVEARLIEADSEVAPLLAAARDHDLLAIGSHGGSRGGGILLGRTGSTLLHRAPGNILVVRRPPGGVEFPTNLLLADDGTDSAAEAARITVDLAARTGALVSIVSPSDASAARRRAMARRAAAFIEVTGMEPVRLDEQGPVPHAISSAAGLIDAALLLVGSRGLKGVSALRSVSERVAHDAPCSVLVARPVQ